MTARPAALLPILLGLAPIAILLLATLPRDVSPIDGGELTAVARTLGVAHPTGYPFWSLLARLATAGGAAASAPWRLALFSTVSGVAALALLAPLFARPGVSGPLVSFLVILAGSLPAFLDAARTQEVYALSLLFFALLARLAHEAGRGRIDPTRAILLGAYLLGLASGVHMTILLSAPALVWLAARSRPRPGVWVASLAFALLGRSIYAVLPIRSALGPLLDWGSPRSWTALNRHVFAWQYRSWMFESTDAILANARVFAREAWSALGPALLLVPLGWALLARRDRAALFATLLLFGASAGYALGYSIHDIATYFLPAQLVVLFWIAAGAAEALARLRGEGPRRAALALLALLFLAPAALSWRERAASARRDARLAEAYARAVIDSLPPRSILFTRFWDLLVSPALYLQIVEGYRTDVTVIDQEHMRRSWHVPLLARQEPALAARARAESAEFLRFLAPFEAGKPYDRDRLQAAYERMLWAVLDADTTRPLFTTLDIERDLVRPYRLVPHRLALRMLRPGDAPPPPDAEAFPAWGEDLLARGEWGPIAASLACEMARRASAASAAAGDTLTASRRLAEAARFVRFTKPNPAS